MLHGAEHKLIGFKNV